MCAHQPTGGYNITIDFGWPRGRVRPNVEVHVRIASYFMSDPSLAEEANPNRAFSVEEMVRPAGTHDFITLVMCKSGGFRNSSQQGSST